MGWTLIQHTALTSSAASVTLGSGGTIPQTYKTLKLVISSRDDVGNQTARIYPNGSSANGSGRRLAGNGASASSSTDSFILFVETSPSDTSNTFGSATADFPNYAGSTNKPISIDSVTENNATTGLQTLTAGLWSQTAAITSIQVIPNPSGNFVSGSTFTLYGLA